MNKNLAIWISLAVFTILSCAGNKTLNKTNPPSQTSVKITLTDGYNKEGIIVTSKNDQLIYVDAETHQVDTLDYFNIARLEESDHIYDFYGHKIPPSEINQYRNYKNTLLYGTGGFVLGTAVGFGAFVAMVLSDSSQVGAANLALAAFAIAGTAVFGKIGYNRDFDVATDKARRQRYATEQKQIFEEKQKLEKLKEEKEQLLKNKQEKAKK